jgi:hypothetical protein
MRIGGYLHCMRQSGPRYCSVPILACTNQQEQRGMTFRIFDHRIEDQICHPSNILALTGNKRASSAIKWVFSCRTITQRGTSCFIKVILRVYCQNSETQETSLGCIYGYGGADMEYKQNVTSICLNFLGSVHLEDKESDSRIILKRIFRKYILRLGCGWKWLVETSDSVAILNYQ